MKKTYVLVSVDLINVSESITTVSSGTEILAVDDDIDRLKEFYQNTYGAGSQVVWKFQQWDKEPTEGSWMTSDDDDFDVNDSDPQQYAMIVAVDRIS